MNYPVLGMLNDIGASGDDEWGTLDELGQFESPLSGVLHDEDPIADEDSTPGEPLGWDDY